MAPTPSGSPVAARRLWAVGALAGVAFLAGLLAGAGGVSGQEKVVERFARAWERGDHRALHELLTPEARKRVSADVLAGAYRAAAATATATRVEAGEPREGENGAWILPVTVATRVFGPVHGEVRLPLKGEDEEARVDWRAHLAFPGLAPGERLERSTELPQRASLLARDGTPLAQGPEREVPLGEAGRAAVGSLEPLPADRAAALRAEGYPEDALVGTSGLERIFEPRLRGRIGGSLRAGGRVLAQRAARPGRPVRTTIAPRVQEAALAALTGRLGGVVAMRPQTGEILGFAGIPFSGLQPPGSVFKIITLAGALSEGLAGPRSTYPFQTETLLAGVPLANANNESCGGDLERSFAHSCNSVFAPLGARLGAARLVSWAERFGFNRPPGVEGAATSVIGPAAEIGDELAVGASAIGQGKVQATALQMTRVAATIATGGRLAGLTLDPARPARPGRRVVAARHAALIRRYMEEVVRDGTGTNAALPGVRVAGKTGTAELRTTHPCEPDPENPESCPVEDQGYDPTDTDAWFVSFAPAREPRVAVGVLLVQSGAGGDTAAPAAREVLRVALQR